LIVCSFAILGSWSDQSKASSCQVGNGGHIRMGVGKRDGLLWKKRGKKVEKGVQQKGGKYCAMHSILNRRNDRDRVVLWKIERVGSYNIEALGAGSSDMDGPIRQQIDCGHQAATRFLADA
nr:hypothetical protein [Tanacetum cinerariifolium]